MRMNVELITNSKPYVSDSKGYMRLYVKPWVTFTTNEKQEQARKKKVYGTLGKKRK